MMQTKVPRPQWTRTHRALAWLSLAVFLVGFILFMVGFTGHSWYVAPVVNNRYPPDNPIVPLEFGLFYLCYRGECKYDMRQDYQVVELLREQPGIVWPYQNYRTACMGIVTVGAIISLLALGCYFLFLSALRISLIVGYITGGLQILSAIISIIGVIIFGRQFYGKSGVAPFGWSFGLTIVGILFFFINGILLILHTVNIHRYLMRARYQAAGRARSTGFLAWLNDCFRAL